MRIFLGVFLILIVSGDDETITAYLEDNVLLPCSCPGRGLDEEVKWQMEEPKKLVLKYNPTQNHTWNRNGSIFLLKDQRNCSVLLTNVTANDQGKYRCIFRSKETYQKIFVNLNVHARYDVCQKELKNMKDGKVFQCDAVGRYPEAGIQWNLGDQPLTASFNANITHDRRREPTGLYHFSSTLIIKLNGTTQPTCSVKTERISNTIEELCDGVSPLPQSQSQNVRQHYVKVIPIMLLLVVFLVLWRSFRSHGVIRR